MTGLLGRRCTRGNALSPPLLMATRLGFHFRASSRSVRSSGKHLFRCDPARPPGKIELHHTLRLNGQHWPCAAWHCLALPAQLPLGGKGDEPFGFPSRLWCFLAVLFVHSRLLSSPSPSSIVLYTLPCMVW